MSVYQSTEDTNVARKPALFWFLANFVVPGFGFGALRNVAGWATAGGFLGLWLFLAGWTLWNYLQAPSLQTFGANLVADSLLLDILTWAVPGLTVLGVAGGLAGGFIALRGRPRAGKVAFGAVAGVLAFALTAGSVYAGVAVDRLNWAAQQANEAAEQAVVPPAPVERQLTPEEIAALGEHANTPWAGQERVNILLLGSDAGPDRWGIRPDITMVVSIDTDTGKALLFSLPRNLSGAKFPETSPAHDVFPGGFNDGAGGLLNAIWTWAESRPDLYPDSPRPGLTAMYEAVGETLGIPLTHHMVVNMQGFRDLVDLLGGVEMDIPRDFQFTPQLRLNAGPDQLLDGENALWYARYRSDSSDYDRQLRQRCLIQGITEQTTMGDVASNVLSLADILGDNFSTNIQQADLAAWLGLFEKTRSQQLGGFAFIPPEINPGNPNWPFIQDKVQEVIELSDALPAPTETPAPGDSTEKPATSGTPAPTETGEPAQSDEPAQDGTTGPVTDPTVVDNPYC